MRILIIMKPKPGILNKHVKTAMDYIKNDGWFSGYYDAMVKKGHKVFLENNVNFFLSIRLAYKNYFLYRLINYFMVKTGLKKIDNILYSRKLGKFVKHNKIDLIFTEVDFTIIPKIVKKFRKEIIISEWFGIFPEMVPKYVRKSLNDFDIIWCPSIYHETLKKYNIDCSKFKYVGSGAINTKELYNDFEEKYKYDVCFIGGISKGHSERIDLLEKIAERYENFVFFGKIEHIHIPSNYKLIKKFKGWADPATMRKLYSSSKIALNFTLNNYDRVERGFNSRLFEIPACNNALQIVSYNKNIEEFFEIDKEVVTFKTAEELLEKIDYFLNNEKARKNLVEKAYIKSFNYNFDERFKKMEEYINEHRGSK